MAGCRAGWPQVESRSDDGDPRLRGCRHARLLLFRGARPEPAGLRGRAAISWRACPAELRGPLAALVRPVPALRWTTISRCSSNLHGRHQNKEPGEDPVGAGESALVLGRGAGTAGGSIGKIQRAAAHASAGDGVSEGICQAPRRRLHARSTISSGSACWGRRMTLGHGVWLNGRRTSRSWRRRGTCVCHNCASNFRLRSGVAPLNRVRGERDQHRDRPRRGRHQRRPGHAAGDAHGTARASRAGHGRRCADTGAGVAHGDLGRRKDDGVRRAAGRAGGGAARPTWC